MTSPLRRTAIVAGVALTFGLAGCSSSSSPDTQATAQATQPAGPTGDAPADGGVAGDAVFGLVAALQDGVMQVQATDSQTAVTWTDTTTFTKTVTVGAADVTVGSCIVAVLPADTTTDDASAGTSADADTGTQVATSVVVSAAVDGQCSAGFGGGRDGAMGAGGLTDLGDGTATGAQGGGTRPTGAPDLPAGGDMPAGMPTGRPSDGEMPTGAMPGGFGGIVAGLVTSVADGVLTVEVSTVDPAAADDAATGDTTTGDTTTDDAASVPTTSTVALDASTVITSSVAADASAVVVGVCASARGATDDRGGMTATSIQISDATDGECTSGLTGMFGGGMAPGQGGGGTDD